MKGLVEEDGPLQKEFGRVDRLERETNAVCHIYNPIIGEVFNALEKVGKFPLRLLPLMAATVLKEGFGNKSAATTTFEDLNHTLPGCTQVSVSALPPDVWTNFNADAGHTDVNELHAFMKDGSTLDMVDQRISLPVAFVSDGPNKHDWHYNEDIEQLRISPTCPYQGGKRKKCRHSPYKPPQMSPLPLPKHPTIAEVTASSGSPTGFASSPSIWKHMAHMFNDWVIHGGDKKIVQENPKAVESAFHTNLRNCV